MSIIPKWLSLGIIMGTALFSLAGSAESRSMSVRLKVVTSPVPRAEITGSFPEPVQAFSFETSRAGSMSLDKRISEIILKDSHGEPVGFRRGAAGIVFTDAPVSSFRYEVFLGRAVDPAVAAHISWLAGDRGLLMPGDLLPLTGDGSHAADIELDLPEGWRAGLGPAPGQERRYSFSDFRDEVFSIGKTLRTIPSESRGEKISFVAQGEWQFTDAEAGRMANEIFSYYQNLIGKLRFPSVKIILIGLPDETAVDRWSAETRGRTLVIASSPSRYRNLGAQRLHEQLRHELLHLWIPNSLDLSGDYAWFYEGFIIYEALRAGVRLGRIRFVDYLNTLSEAYRYTVGPPARPRSDQVPLAALGEKRWEGNAGALYSKGLVVAFLCDVEMISAERGRGSTADLLREIYKEGSAGGEPRDGAGFVLEVMNRRPELASIIRDYINGKEMPDWGPALEKAGLSAPVEGFQRKLVVRNALSGGQKAILKRLGYNVSR